MSPAAILAVLVVGGALGAALGPALPAAAQPDPAGPAFAVSSATVGVGPSPEVAGNARGEAAVLWLGDCDGFGLCLTSYDAAGQPVTAERRLDASTPVFDRAPAAALGSPGPLWVVWARPIPGSDTADVVGRRYALDGTPLAAEVVVATGALGRLDSPDVAALPGGGAVVVWTRLAPDFSGLAIEGRRLGSQGQPLGPVFRVDESAADLVGRPAVAADAGGGFIVAWESFGFDADGDDVMARVFAADATPLGGEHTVHLQSSSIQDSPAVAASPQGEYLVAWESRASTGPGPGVYARRVAATGPLGPSETRVHAAGGDLRALPSAAGWPGGFAVAWQTVESDRERVSLRSYDSALVPQAGEVLVTSPAASIHDTRPGVLADGAGNLLVAWNRRDEQFARRIFARRYLGPPPEPCAVSDTALCLLGGRFRVEVSWHDQRSGDTGVGTAVPYGDQTGFFWFFDEANLELVVKSLDGRPVNGYYWLFYGALSDVEYTLTVTDTVSGERRFYDNPPGEICGRGDNAAFPLGGPVGGALTAGSGAAATAEPRRPARWKALAVPAPAGATSGAGGSGCVEDDEHLCLLGERFRVEVSWRDQRSGDTGVGTAVHYGDQTGFFWFFDDANLELVVKSLDGRPVNGYYWLFYGALSDVEYTITVTDTQGTGVATYHNEPGEICGRGDTAAF